MASFRRFIVFQAGRLWSLFPNSMVDSNNYSYRYKPEGYCAGNANRVSDDWEDALFASWLFVADPDQRVALHAADHSIVVTDQLEPFLFVFLHDVFDDGFRCMQLVH